MEAEIRTATPASLATFLSRGAWKKTPHLRMLSDWMLQAAAGHKPRILVTMPPRHGKSEMISHWLPIWILEHDLSAEVLLCSYGADFAASWGRRVRNTIRDNADKLNIRLSDDSGAAHRWHTQMDGSMLTAGVGGPITGRGADWLIIDDPVKNAEEAHSKTYRDKVWEWYVSTASTRLEPGGRIILVMTRWHTDDLGGRLLDQASLDGEPWAELHFPAIAGDADPLGRAPGAALWPERYDEKGLDAIKRRIGDYWFSALYQGQPYVREGGLFQRGWFDVVADYPRDASITRYWDLAGTQPKHGGDPDYTVGAKIAAKGGEYWIVDIRRDRLNPPGVERLVKSMAEMDGRECPIVIEQEPGSSGLTAISYFQRSVLAGYEVRGDRVTGAKELRAGPLSSAAEAGNVHLVRGSWNEALLNEFEQFPNGSHDDQVDAVSGAMLFLTDRAEAFVV